MQDDAALFRQFASQNSEEAFAELVRRHVDLVYSAALRRVAGHSGLAQDIAQEVFSDLARKAHSLPPGTVLVAWLHRATQLASAAAVRAETHRIAREQQAAAMQSLEQSDRAPAWDSIRPVLDEVLDSLDDRDRAALLLRFFREHSFREVGSALGVSEDAARMRVGRALDKLRDLLAARGVTTTAAALSAALAAQAVQAAPFGLATLLTGAALAGGAASVSTSTVGLINIMTSTKLISGIVTLLAVAAATTAVIEHRRLAAYRLENDALRQEMAQRPATAPLNNVIDAAEQAQRQREHRELVRLRGEVTLLRQQQRKLDREARKDVRTREDTATAANLDSESSQEEEWRQQGIVRMNFSKQWVLALLLFAKENDNTLPETFEKANPYLEKAMAQSSDQEPSPLLDLRTDQFEIVYKGSLSEIAEPAKTIVIREKEPVQKQDGGRFKTYGFADGHSEFHREGLRGFDEWERERMPKNQSPDSTAP